MSQSQTRSHKGYRTVPIYHSKRRNGTSESESASNEINELDVPGTESKYSKKICTNKISQTVVFVIVLFIFLGATILIYGHMPPSESSLPPENIKQELNDTTQSQIHSKMNHIIAPAFNIDISTTDSIPQTNPIQTFTDSHGTLNGKDAVLYFLEHTQSEQHDFCILLMSLSSMLSTITHHRIEIIVLIPDTFSMDTNKISLERLANRMNFTLIKYQNSAHSWLKQIITILQPMQYDSILYINHNSFVLQDVSILFPAPSETEYSIGGIWSFENSNNNNEYMPCLLGDIVLVVLPLDMNNVPPFCQTPMESSDIDIGALVMEQMKQMSAKYGIVAFPWWYEMEHLQFKTYYGLLQDDRHNGLDTAWLEYMTLFESKTQSKPTPFLIDLRKLNHPNQDSFWSGWTAKWQHSVQFCQDHY